MLRLEAVQGRHVELHHWNAALMTLDMTPFSFTEKRQREVQRKADELFNVSLIP